MADARRFSDVGDMLGSWAPAEPVYCVYPAVYHAVAQHFRAGFPGRVLYAVKANDEPAVVRELYRGGIRHFDCASLPEVRLIREHCPESTVYFMVPVRLRGAARAAQADHGVRHFMIDHLSALAPLAGEIDMSRSVVFVRMAVHHDAALQNLSSKFGAKPKDVPQLLGAVKAAGAEPALAFNVGSSVTEPGAYSHALEMAGEVLGKLPYRLRLVDIGGGFPRSYPGFSMPPLEDYFEAISRAAGRLPLQPGGELMAEPGRALAAPGLSAVVEVILRKRNRVYINDGMYGIFWELRFKGHDRYPVRAYRDGRELAGPSRPFRIFGPTCDATDVLPAKIELPDTLRAGDYLEFGCLGAYSLGGRTRFNGHFSDQIVEICSTDAAPPGWDAG
jgi:ornithine decarboxylase